MARINNITAIKGVFALFVLTHHCLSFAGILQTNASGLMACFFALSGFGLTLGYKDRLLNGDNNNKLFFISRVSKLFPLQWLVLLLLFILSLFGIGNIVSYWAFPFQMTLIQSINPFWAINFTLNGPSWFISDLLFFYLAYPLLLKLYFLHKKEFIVSYCLLLACFVVLAVFLPETIGRRWPCYISPFARIFDFVLGIFIADIYLNNNLPVKKNNFLVCSCMEVLSISLMICSLFMHFNFSRRYIPVTIWYPTIIFLILTFSIQDQGLLSKLFKLRPFQLIGCCSLSIYMIQGAIFPIFDYNLPVILKCVLFYSISLIIAFVLTKFFVPWSSKKFVEICKYGLMGKENMKLHS